MQWYADNLAAEGTTNTPADQAKVHMIMGLASIRIVSMITTLALTDLATHPECIAPLRQEIDEMLANEGGTFTKQGLLKLLKLDSFMKESQRMSPLHWGKDRSQASTRRELLTSLPLSILPPRSDSTHHLH